MKEKGTIAKGKLCRSLKNNINLQDKIYSVEDVVKMIQSGDIAIATNIIKGVHGAKYVRTPSNEDMTEYDYRPAIFYLDDTPYTIPMIIANEVEWFQLGPILSMLSLNNTESDIQAIATNIPFEMKRVLTFKGHGYRRTYVRIEALEQFWVSTEKKTIVKKKVNLYFNSITTFKINLPILRNRVSQIMNNMSNIEDKIFMGDIYRILSQLE